jgi:hypothetical protein
VACLLTAASPSNHFFTARRGKRLQKHYTVYVCAVEPAARRRYAPRLNEEHREWRWLPLAQLGMAHALTGAAAGAAGAAAGAGEGRCGTGALGAGGGGGGAAGEGAAGVAALPPLALHPVVRRLAEEHGRGVAVLAAAAGGPGGGPG